MERSEQSPVLQPLFDLHRCLPDERDQPGSICHRCITVHPLYNELDGDFPDWILLAPTIP